METAKQYNIPVIKINEVLKHPNADLLEIVMVNGYSVCVRKGDFKPEDLACYFEPDFMVDPSRPEFNFLGSDAPIGTMVRIKVKKLRGTISQGLLIKAPPGFAEGDDVFDHFGIQRWQPFEPISTKGEACGGPSLYSPVYDLENLLKYNTLLKEGEEVAIFEKLEGSNLRAVYHNNTMYMGSHYTWKRPHRDNLWWKALIQNKWIYTWCKQHPDHILYAEVVNNIRGFNYGHSPGQLGIYVFDILKGNSFLSWNDICSQGLSTGLQWAPTLYQGPFDYQNTLKLAEGKSTVANTTHIKEGAIVVPVSDRHDAKYGRLKFKVKSNEYLMR